MSAYTIKADPAADPLIMAMPLRGDVSLAVAADLNDSGRGKCCASCDKPFNAARKQRAVGRITHHAPASGQIFTTSWLFCGACAATIRRNGGRMPAHLVQEARAAASAGLLLAAPAEGNA